MPNSSGEFSHAGMLRRSTPDRPAMSEDAALYAGPGPHPIVLVEPGIDRVWIRDSRDLLQSFVTLYLHQQYLARNINGYRCHGTTGVPYPTP